MNPREQRGVVIAALCKLTQADGRWVVPSQTLSDKRYVLTDTVDMLIAVHVHPTDIMDRNGINRLLSGTGACLVSGPAAALHTLPGRTSACIMDWEV